MSLLDLLLRTHHAWQSVWPLRGRYAVRHIVYLASRLGLLKPSWFTVREGFSMYLDPKDYLQREILCNGEWEAEETDFIRSALRAGQVFIDVGANIGYFTLLAAKIVGEHGSVPSIEPNSFAASRVREHLNQNNLQNVFLERVACSDCEQVGILYLDNKSNCAASSLSSKNAAGLGVSVKCRTVDQLVKKYRLKRVDLIKIDVEGAELSVLRGMASTLKCFKPILLMELEPQLLWGFGVKISDVVNYLTSIDYVPSPIKGSKNYLFSPSPEARHRQAVNYAD